MFVDLHVGHALVDACVDACIDQATILVLGIMQDGEHGMELWHAHKHFLPSIFLSVHHQVDWALQHFLLLVALAHPRMSLLR